MHKPAQTQATARRKAAKSSKLGAALKRNMARRKAAPKKADSHEPAKRPEASASTADLRSNPK